MSAVRAARARGRSGSISETLASFLPPELFGHVSDSLDAFHGGLWLDKHSATMADCAR